MVRINFGCGSVQPESWINIDKDPIFEAPWENMWQQFTLPESIDYIVAHHSLQCTPFNDLQPLFKRFLDILKPGGVLRVSLPDIVAAFDAYEEENMEWFPNHQNHEYIDTVFCTYLSWYSTNINPMTAECLIDQLIKAGFTKASYSQYRTTEHTDTSIIELDSRPKESIYIEAVK